MDNKMTAEQALAIAKELRDACVGHPHAKIPWPHRILHEGAKAIEQLAALSAPRVPDGWIEDAESVIRANQDDANRSSSAYFQNMAVIMARRIKSLAAAPEPVAPELRFADARLLRRALQSLRLGDTADADKCIETVLSSSPDFATTDAGFIDVPANLRRQTNTEQHAEQVIADLRAEVEALKADAERYRAGLIAVEYLINNSTGVYGMHLNGDCSPWGDILTGGRFEEWLMDFDAAIDAARLREGGGQ